MARKQVKAGVHAGGGPPPGYAWGVALLDVLPRESHFLHEDQRRHLALQVKELAKQNDPTHSDTISLDAVEDFHEIRDWGGILGDLNVRLFFGVDKKRRLIVVLGLIKKQRPNPFGRQGADASTVAQVSKR